MSMMGSVHLFGVVQAHRTSSNLLEPHHYARCVEFCHMSSGCFDCTEPSLSTSLQGKQGMKGGYALVRGGSSTSNLIVEFIPLQLPTNSLRRTKHTPSSICLRTLQPYLSNNCVCFLANLQKATHNAEYLKPWCISRSVSL